MLIIYSWGPPFFSLHTETTLQITRSNPAYFDRKHKSGLYFLHSFNQLNQIILITVLLFRISRPSIFSGVTVSLWKYRVWGCRISSIGNQTGYSTIDQYRHSLAEIMNFSKNKNVWPLQEMILMVIVIMIATLNVYHEEFRFTQECHQFINVHIIDWWVDCICTSPSGFSCEETW